jgi:hypothetical protein
MERALRVAERHHQIMCFLGARDLVTSCGPASQSLSMLSKWALFVGLVKGQRNLGGEEFLVDPTECAS